MGVLKDSTVFQPASPAMSPGFPTELIGKKVLLATESLGPVNGVSRTTQSLVDYLRSNGVHVATCAPYYKGQHISGTPEPQERIPIVNKDWVRAIEAKSSALGSRAIGGAWQWHYDRDDASETQTSSYQQRRPRILTNRSEEVRRKVDLARKRRENPEFRLQGFPLPYNPDLTVAYPFRLGRVYSQTFTPDVIYLASPASVGFQFLVQLDQMNNPPPALLNFQTDLSAYAGILFAPPLDRYAVFLLQMVQGYLFRAPAVRSIFYPSAYVRQYMVDAGAPAEKMHQLGRGVDTKLFNPSRRDEAYRRQLAPNGETIFVCISRLAPEKGFEFLAQVARRMHTSGLPFKLLIVGGNKNPAVDNEVRSYFRGLTSDEDQQQPNDSKPSSYSASSAPVVFTGFLRGEALARAYAVGDVFLHCSVTETFGLVVLEAMASGVPVIARDEGGPSETVQHSTSGFLVPPADLEKFTGYAEQLARDVGLRERMAVAARAQALETTWDKINNQVALRLAEVLREPEVVREGMERVGFYGSWVNFVRVYFAVGVVWVFWGIAVVPMLLCGFVHGLFK